MKNKLITVAIIVCVSIGCVFLLRSQNIMDKLNVRNALEKVSRDVVKLEDENSKVSIKLGNEIEYSHRVHSSVGSSYRVDYDKSAFKLSYETKYDNPESVAMGMCGGDSAVQTCTFRALKKGTYTIKVIHEFRGDIEKIITYTITVI